MLGLSHVREPLPALGMTSFVLGVIGLLLFFLPILGAPLSACGILCGVVGIVGPWAPSSTSVRWAWAGLAASCMALGINVAVAYAPAGYLHFSGVPRQGRPASDHSYVAPPSKSSGS